MTLEREFRQVIREMMLVSHGTTMRWNASTRGGERASPLPPGEREPLHEAWITRWVQTRPSDRLSVLEGAREALQEARVQRAGVVVEPGTVAWKREIANSDLPDRELVRLYSVSRQSLWRYRRDYGEDAA
jgi:hypothetical protein